MTNWYEKYLPVATDDPRSLVEALEALVDKAGMATVLDALATVCQEKITHLHNNGEDDRSTDIRYWASCNCACQTAERRVLARRAELHTYLK